MLVFCVHRPTRHFVHRCPQWLWCFHLILWRYRIPQSLPLWVLMLPKTANPPVLALGCHTLHLTLLHLTRMTPLQTWYPGDVNIKCGEGHEDGIKCNMEVNVRDNASLWCILEFKDWIGLLGGCWEILSTSPSPSPSKSGINWISLQLYIPDVSMFIICNTNYSLCVNLVQWLLSQFSIWYQSKDHLTLSREALEDERIVISWLVAGVDWEGLEDERRMRTNMGKSL